MYAIDIGNQRNAGNAGYANSMRDRPNTHALLWN